MFFRVNGAATYARGGNKVRNTHPVERSGPHVVISPAMIRSSNDARGGNKIPMDLLDGRLSGAIATAPAVPLLRFL